MKKLLLVSSVGCEEEFFTGDWVLDIKDGALHIVEGDNKTIYAAGHWTRAQVVPK